MEAPLEIKCTTVVRRRPRDASPFRKSNLLPASAARLAVAAGRARLSSRMPSASRKSSKNSREYVDSFASSVASSVTSIPESPGEDDGGPHDAAPFMSPDDAAKIVADEYFEGRGVGSPSSPDAELFSTPSLLDDVAASSVDEPLEEEDEDEACCGEGGDDTASTCSRGTASAASSKNTLALEVGMSAHEYLEECFYTEVSVLDRDKFDAVPEIVKSDFTVLGHLGKGSFSDVFEVASHGCELLESPKVVISELAPAPVEGRRRPRIRRTTHASSVTTATLSRPSCCDDKPTFALKCLRPQIRSDADQFMIGAEDLVHETAVLANLDHPNIIKLHGRAAGSLQDAFVLNDGYFILLDRLGDTLHDRIDSWRRNPKCVLKGPTTVQLDVARTIADAMVYLHSKKIIFRDLKPANVGFDPSGVLKLFDFGFATGLPEADDENPMGFLFDRCGTPRYMAPEVGLSLGYALPSDVYSFGVLLWEVCSMCKPFAHIKSAEEFDDMVFVGGERPKVEGRWPASVKDLITRCWSSPPSRRPTMEEVGSELSAMSGERRSPLVRMPSVRSSWTRRKTSEV